jgi:DNA-binding NtrC family response regulator
MMSLQALVLIVKDEAGVRAFLADTLRLHGYHALLVGAVREAEAAQQRLGPAGIDLVVANIRLKVRGGRP